MRIIAGKWKGTPLQAPQGLQTRPILDKVKGAVFNILGAYLAQPGELPPVAVLDLFCGTGSLGLEALSRGAAFCTFVEAHRPTAGLLRQTLGRLAATPLANVLHHDAWKLDPDELNSPQPFRLIFVDPPYRQVLDLSESSPLLRLAGALHRSTALSENALMIFRHPVRMSGLPLADAGWHLFQERPYGQMAVSFLARRP